MSESHLPLIRTLIVDDEIDICHLLSGILRRRNMEASFVNSLSEARVALKEAHPDILFLDNYLPDGLGLDFIHYVREQYPKTKVVVITAHDSMRERERAIAEGAVEFIGKPFTVESITNTLEKINLKG